MPCYEFVCQDCGAPYEARLSMSAYTAGEGRQCPACGSSNVERAFTAVSVITGGRSGGGGSCGNSGGSGFT
jgi:putative FmdB family regulatory protein